MHIARIHEKFVYFFGIVSQHKMYIVAQNCEDFTENCKLWRAISNANLKVIMQITDKIHKITRERGPIIESIQTMK